MVSNRGGRKNVYIAIHWIVRPADTCCMILGANGQDAVAFTCPAPAGGKLTFQFRLWANAEEPGVLDKVRRPLIYTHIYISTLVGIPNYD